MKEKKEFIMVIKGKPWNGNQREVSKHLKDFRLSLNKELQHSRIAQIFLMDEQLKIELIPVK